MIKFFVNVINNYNNILCEPVMDNSYFRNVIKFVNEMNNYNNVLYLGNMIEFVNGNNNYNNII